MELRFQEVIIQNGRKRMTEPVTFSVQTGTTTAILGPSQSGKSTLLLYASGFIRESRGVVSLVDDDVEKTPRWRYVGLGPIPKFAPLFETLTVSEQLRCQIRLYKGRSPRLRAQELLEIYQLEDVQRERVKDLDRFAYARLSVATAMCHHPKFLVLDEPETGLTQSEWSNMEQVFRQLNRRDVGILFTTALTFATATAHQVVSLPRGEVNRRWQSSPFSVSNGNVFGETN